MKLYSTNNRDLKVDFQSAVFNSMPQDKGLYMPVTIPVLDDEFLQHLDQYTLPEIAYTIASALLQDDIPADDLKAIIEDAINFDAPVKQLNEQTYVLELFHGPSLAFKDFGARFMSRIMAYFLKDNEKMLDVLVEPTRSILIPDFYKMRSIAMEMGAISFGISGSGPSVFALTKDEATAQLITAALQKQLQSIQINSLSFVSSVNKKGPVILD